MTEQEMLEKVLSIFPNASMGEDNDGQLVIYTDMRIAEDSTIEAMEEN